MISSVVYFCRGISASLCYSPALKSIIALDQFLGSRSDLSRRAIRFTTRFIAEVFEIEPATPKP
jgi:hypothetical protein